MTSTSILRVQQLQRFSPHSLDDCVDMAYIQFCVYTQPDYRSLHSGRQRGGAYFMVGIGYKKLNYIIHDVTSHSESE